MTKKSKAAYSCLAALILTPSFAQSGFAQSFQERYAKQEAVKNAAQTARMISVSKCSSLLDSRLVHLKPGSQKEGYLINSDKTAIRYIRMSNKGCLAMTPMILDDEKNYINKNGECTRALSLERSESSESIVTYEHCPKRRIPIQRFVLTAKSLMGFEKASSKVGYSKLNRGCVRGKIVLRGNVDGVDFRCVPRVSKF